MSIFVIKIIACISMCLDHVKYAIPETRGWETMFLGRIAFPLYAFLAVEGYIHTSNVERYFKRLIIFALISQIPFMLFRTLVGEWMMLNIMFTLLFGLLTIFVFDRLQKRYYLSIPIIVVLICMGEFLNVDYGWFGVATVFLFYLCREHKFIRILAFLFLTSVFFYKKIFDYFSINNMILYLCMNIPTIIMLFYNGNLGKKTKYFYYWFYPVHMALLYAISLIYKF